MQCRFGPADREQLIEWCVGQPQEKWQWMTTQISWLHRQPDTSWSDVPMVLARVVEHVMDPEAWDSVRREVRRLRQVKHATEKVEREASAEERRRQYMRSYMARRRRRKE